MKSNSKQKSKQSQDGKTTPTLLSENAQALKAVQDALSRRDLSAEELKSKLTDKHSKEALAYALEQARAKRWLRDEEEIAEDAVQMLENKLKSHAFIKKEMEKRGLPTTDLDFTKEQDKINELIQKRFSHVDLDDAKEKMKVVRFLVNRGFDLRSIQSVIKDVDIYFED